MIVLVLVLVGAAALVLLMAERGWIPSMRSPRMLGSALSSITSTEERETATARVSPDRPSEEKDDALAEPARHNEPPSDADVEVIVRRRLYGPRGG